MKKNTFMKWAIVQHSGFGFAGNPQFAKGLELALVSDQKTADKVTKAGGLLFDSYKEADEYSFKEMYNGVEGLLPRAQGSFSRVRISDLRIYIPKMKLDKVSV